MVKIVPPEGWKPPHPEQYLNPDQYFPTKRQDLKQFKEGTGFSDGLHYTLREYEKMADGFYRDWCTSRYQDKTPTYEDLERDYWRIIGSCMDEVVVEYANDLDTDRYGSGFPIAADMKDSTGTVDIGRLGEPPPVWGQKDYYERCGWNLNNLPFWPGSVLRDMRAPVNGVNVPWLYRGQLFSTFCWHTEDNYMYSMNYHHAGAPKVRTGPLRNHPSS